MKNSSERAIKSKLKSTKFAADFRISDKFVKVMLAEMKSQEKRVFENCLTYLKKLHITIIER